MRIGRDAERKQESRLMVTQPSGDTQKDANMEFSDVDEESEEKEDVCV